MKIKHKDIEGTTLLEILISLIILSTGLLALAKSQIHSLQYHNAQYFYTFAINQVINLAEIIQAYSTHDAIQPWIKDWQQACAKTLPHAETRVEKHTGYYEIFLAWKIENQSVFSCNQPSFTNYDCVNFTVQTQA